MLSCVDVAIVLSNCKIIAEGSPNKLIKDEKAFKETINQKGFVLEARRWIVERTLAWLGKNRRLSKDYELITTSSLSMIYLAMVRLMLRRIVELN